MNAVVLCLSVSPRNILIMSALIAPLDHGAQRRCLSAFAGVPWPGMRGSYLQDPIFKQKPSLSRFKFWILETRPRFQESSAYPYKRTIP